MHSLHSPRASYESLGGVSNSSNHSLHSNASASTAEIDHGAIYSDRFIPSRIGSTLAFSSNLASAQGGAQSSDNDDGNGNNSANSNVHVQPSAAPNQTNTGSSSNPSQAAAGATGTGAAAGTESQALLTTLLRNELLGASSLPPSPPPKAAQENCAPGSSPADAPPPSPNMLRFKAPRQRFYDETTRAFTSLSPIGNDSQRLLASPKRATRKIPKVRRGAKSERSWATGWAEGRRAGLRAKGWAESERLG